MTTTINASTSSGLITTPDNSGAIALQNNGTTGLNIDASGRVTMPNQPIFMAYDSPGGGGTVSSGQVAPWSQTLVNVGGHFSTSTYRFTAPIAGVYEFTLFGIMGPNVNGQALINIRKNGTNIVRMHRNTSSSYMFAWEQGSVSLTISLVPNDYIDVYIAEGTLYMNSEIYSGFMGKLVQ